MKRKFRPDKSLGEARCHFFEDYDITLDQVQTALYFDEFDEAEELAERFAAWANKMADPIDDYDLRNRARLTTLGMKMSLWMLLPQEAA